MNVVYRTDIGKVREQNQDFLVCDSKHKIYIVADGLGGYKYGDVASKYCANLLHRFIMRMTKEEFVHQIGDYIVNINEKLIEHSYARFSGALMGTTLLGVKFFDPTSKEFGLVSVGDTTLYGMKDNTIEQINQRHSAKKGSNVLNSALGRGLLGEVDYRIIENEYDFLLLCTDGLTGELSEEEILHLVKEGDFSSAGDRLVDAALSKEANDNITIVLVDLREVQ